MPAFKKIINTFLLASICFLFSFQAPAFKADQLKYSRVKTAYKTHWEALKSLLRASHLDTGCFNLYLRVFKEEGLLEIWAKNRSQNTYVRVKTFSVCAKSGNPGPKRRQGDGQVPEGFYEISAFQPASSYHLALKVSYPNASDRIKATVRDPGGDIMIHGNCVTIGCIPIQDAPIEELYVLCVESKNQGAAIFTDIYPFKFNEKNVMRMEQTADKELVRFWTGLKQACDHFDSTHRRPKISTDPKGNYLIASH